MNCLQVNIIKSNESLSVKFKDTIEHLKVRCSIVCGTNLGYDILITSDENRLLEKDYYVLMVKR